MHTEVTKPSESIRILILSTPKTGNVWLRTLLHYAYDAIPIIDFPADWSQEFENSLPPSFIGHQHYIPSTMLNGWIKQNDVITLTTVRHPGDVFLSLFNFVKWNEGVSDATIDQMNGDGHNPGAGSSEYIKRGFQRILSISIAWARMNSYVIKYENLCENPLLQLIEITNKIRPVKYNRALGAVLLGQPQLMKKNIIDARHLNSHRSGNWINGLNDSIKNVLKNTAAYKRLSEDYGYSLDAIETQRIDFDYSVVDPFKGSDTFDNGENIGFWIKKFFYYNLKDSFARWVNPLLTTENSYWDWLKSPTENAMCIEGISPDTYTNIMHLIYTSRDDLQTVFKNPLENIVDRLNYAFWFIDRIPLETDISWGLVAPTLDAYCDII